MRFVALDCKALTFWVTDVEMSELLEVTGEDEGRPVSHADMELVIDEGDQGPLLH